MIFTNQWRFLRIFISCVLVSSLLAGPLQAQQLVLPQPKSLLNTSKIFNPMILRGVTVHPDDPFLFDFLFDQGDATDDLTDEADQLVKYFVATLATPNQNLWVNLSPFEKDRVVDDELAQTQLGRDMLAQDYILKQLSASLLHPDNEIGKKFWKRVYAQAYEKYGHTDIPIDTFHKIWITPKQAKVYQDGNTAYVGEAELDVMLEQDYLAAQRHSDRSGGISDQRSLDSQGSLEMTKEIMRDIIIPAIKEEVNHGTHFAPLRQMFHSMILAKWYKQVLKKSLLAQLYVDQETNAGNELVSAEEDIKRVYAQYVQAYEDGVYDLVKEEKDLGTGELVPHKYFSGGTNFTAPVEVEDMAMVTNISLWVRKIIKKGLLRAGYALEAKLLEAPFRKFGMTAKEAEVLIHQPHRYKDMTDKEKMALRMRMRQIMKHGKIDEVNKLPTMIYLSDQHGGIDRFDALLLDAFRQAPASKNNLDDILELDPNKTLREQFAERGLDIKDFIGQLYFYNGGDLVHRGSAGLAVIKRSKELIELQLSEIVTGNHDLWELMNKLGLHLPWYDGYNFYNYLDRYDEEYGNVEEKVIVFRKNNPVKGTSKVWWSKKLAEYVKSYQDEQKSEENAARNKLARSLFNQLTKSLDDDGVKLWAATEEGELFSRLVGFDVRVGGNVYTGTRAIGHMSVKWWEDLLEKFEVYYSEHKESIQSSDERSWEGAIDLIKNNILPYLDNIVLEKLKSGKWWWRVFQALDYKNYESPEWWAKDAIFHKDWGTALLKEASSLVGEDVTEENYIEHNSMKEMDIFKEKFNLYTDDMYGTTLLHAIPPIDLETGEFYFTYKGVEYRGKGDDKNPSSWDGMKILSNDVRSLNGNILEVYEALTLVNFWYADRTTESKAFHVAQAINKFGADHIARVNGKERIALGHTPFYEYKTKLTPEQRGKVDNFIVFGETEFQESFKGRIIFTDHGMSERYNHRGAYVAVAPRWGIKSFGFEYDHGTEIQRNPRTLQIVRETGKEKVVFKNRSYKEGHFRRHLIAEIEGDMVQAGIRHADKGEKDFAMKADELVSTTGGIDMIEDSFIELIGDEGSALNVDIDPSQLQELRRNFNSLTPVAVTPLQPAVVGPMGFKAKEEDFLVSR